MQAPATRGDDEEGEVGHAQVFEVRALGPPAPPGGPVAGLNLRGWAPRSRPWFGGRVQQTTEHLPPGDPQAELARLYRYAPIYVVPHASVGRMRRTSSSATLGQPLHNTLPYQHRYSDQLQPRSMHSADRSQSVPPHNSVLTRVRHHVTIDRLYYTEIPPLPRSTGLVEQPRLILEGASRDHFVEEVT